MARDRYPPDITRDTLLGDAQLRMQAHYAKGTHCPLCNQFAKIYPRTLHSGLGYGAIRLWVWQREHPGQFAHLPRVVGRRGAEEAKLRYWGLIEPEKDQPEGGRNGYWRLTEAGIDWVLGHTSHPPYVWIYDSKPMGPPRYDHVDGSEKPAMSIRDSLGTDFDYDALMRGEAVEVGDEE